MVVMGEKRVKKSEIEFVDHGLVYVLVIFLVWSSDLSSLKQLWLPKAVQKLKEKVPMGELLATSMEARRGQETSVHLL